MKTKITLEHLKTLDPCIDGLDWYVDNIKTENILEVLLQLNSHKPNWSRWLMVRLLSKRQNQLLAIFSAESVLHIYEEKYTEDTRVRECIQAAKDYLDDKIDKRTLIDKRRAAYAAYVAAYVAAAYAAANVADVAAHSATYASTAASATNVAAAAYATVYAADAAANAYANDTNAYANDARKEIQEKIINEAWRLLNES